MTKGRPADPTRATRKTGNRPKPGEAPIAKEVVPTVVYNPTRQLPSAPEGLPEGAVTIWNRVVEELDTRGLKESDLEAVTMLAHSAWVHAEARRKIAETGVLVKGPRGPIVNPLVKIARDEAATYLRLANEFGLTPASRLRLGLMTLAGQSLAQTLSDDLSR